MKERNEIIREFVGTELYLFRVISMIVWLILLQ